MKLSHDSGIPFYRQVEDQLRQLIKSGQLEEGARLPSVRELARELMVSLITVRRSYADLEKEGWIIRKQGQGTFVAEVSSASLQEEVREEAKELVREAIEQAQRMGLEGDALRTWILELLDEEESNEEHIG